MGKRSVHEQGKEPHEGDPGRHRVGHGELSLAAGDLQPELLDVPGKERRKLLVQQRKKRQRHGLRRERSGLQLLAVAGVAPGNGVLGGGHRRGHGHGHGRGCG